MLKAAVKEACGFSMNTEITYRVFGENSAEAINFAEVELQRLESKLSRYRQVSEVSEINGAAGKAQINISSEMCEILSCAIRISELTEGLYDITVGPLIDLWDYKHSVMPPKEEKINEARAKVNYHDLLLDDKKKTAGLIKEGQSIDLGGIGKGYASDCCIKTLRDNGASAAFINIGGNVATLAYKPDGSPWNVGIRHPRRSGCLIGAVKVSGKAVVTSGDYERYFVDCEGKRWHHILNPSTGFPSESGLISVTVVADSAMLADALSTAIFVAGIDKGLTYLNQFAGSEAILVDN
nr:FAD:protein FMN transferase [Oscillospiraceae bacterium]